MWFIPAQSSREGNHNSLLSNKSLFYHKTSNSNNKCDNLPEKQTHILEQPRRALKFNYSSSTNKPYSFILMHHLRTKIRRKSSKYSFSSSSNGHTVHADSVLHVGHGRRRAIGAGDRAASERVDWDFVAFPPPPSSSSNSASVSSSSTSNNTQQQLPHHYQHYNFGGGITGAGIAEEKPIVFHWDEPETYQNHHVQPQLHPRAGGQRSHVPASQPLSEYPFEQQNFGFTLGEDPLPPPVPPRIPTKHPPPLPPTSSSLRRNNNYPRSTRNNGTNYHYPHHPGGYDRCKNGNSEQHMVQNPSRPVSLYARLQPTRQNVPIDHDFNNIENNGAAYCADVNDYPFQRNQSSRSSRKRPRSSGHSPCSIGSDSPPTPGQRISSRPPPLPPHQYHYRQRSHQESRSQRDYHYHRHSNSDIWIPSEFGENNRNRNNLENLDAFDNGYQDAPAVPKHMHGSGIPMALPLSPPAPPPPPHASPNPVLSPTSISSTDLLQDRQHDSIAYNHYQRPGTLLRDIDASLRRTLDSPFYRRPQSLACSSIGFGGTGVSSQMERDRRSKASTVNSMRTEPRTFGSVSRASINRAGSLGSSYMLPERPPSPLPYDSSPRRLLSPGIISPSPSPPRRSLTYQHHPYDEVPRSDRGKIVSYRFE